MAQNPQAMGTTHGALESRGLVQRRSDPSDGRRPVMSLTAAGTKTLRNKRDAGVRALGGILGEQFTSAGTGLGTTDEAAA